MKRDLYALFSMQPHARGKAFESVLNRLFKHVGIGVREAFTLAGVRGEGIVEQIDGVIEFDGELYLVEAKWLANNIGPPELQELVGKVFTRNGARGLFIADPGYTPAAVTTTQALGQMVLALCCARELFTLFEGSGDNVDPDNRGMAQAQDTRGMAPTTSFRKVDGLLGHHSGLPPATQRAKTSTFS